MNGLMKNIARVGRNSARTLSTSYPHRRGEAGHSRKNQSVDTVDTDRCKQQIIIINKSFPSIII